MQYRVPGHRRGVSECYSAERACSAPGTAWAIRTLRDRCRIYGIAARSPFCTNYRGLRVEETREEGIGVYLSVMAGFIVSRRRL